MSEGNNTQVETNAENVTMNIENKSAPLNHLKCNYSVYSFNKSP